MSDHPKKYPDESEIENILDRVRDVAWKDSSLSIEEESELVKGLKWVLDIWHKKYLGHDRLTKAISKYYLSAMKTSKIRQLSIRNLTLSSVSSSTTFTPLRSS